MKKLLDNQSVPNITILFFVATAGASLLGFLGRSWWLFEILSHFYNIYFFVLIVTLTLLLVYKKYTYAVFNVVMVLISGWLVFSVYLPAPQSTNTPGETMRLLTLNTNYYISDPERISADIISHDPDLIVLVEPSEQFYGRAEVLLSNTYPYRYYIGESGPFNVALLAKIEITEPEITPLENSNMFIARTVFEHQEQEVALYAIHPMPPFNQPVAKQRTEYYKIMAELAQQEPGPVIMAGDYNTTTWSPLFRDLLNDSGLRDSRKGFGLHPTWPTFVPTFAQIPLDQVLVSRDITVTNRIIGKSVGSDHLPVIIDFALDD